MRILQCAFAAGLLLLGLNGSGRADGPPLNGAAAVENSSPSSAASPAPITQITLPKPLPATLAVRAGNTFEILNAKVLAWGTDTLSIETKDGSRQIIWTDLSPATGYPLRLKLIDRKSTQGWLDAGTYGWQMGHADATTALSHAVSMDPALKPAADAVRKTPFGAAVTASIERCKLHEPAKYEKSTPELDAVAIAAYRKEAEEIQKAHNMTFRELQTDHFLIFTDWDPKDDAFLKRNLEAAYAVVSRQFDIPVTENVFLGKLPVYMLAEHNEFMRFANEVDQFPVGDRVAGYYRGNNHGIGHMLMFKPAIMGGDIESAKIRWARVLTHEFTHAFVARYRNNRHIPTWLDEGTAEIICYAQFPDPTPYYLAKRIAASGQSIAPIFQSDDPKPGEAYPVMQTLAETLLRRDHKAFLKLYDELKAGVPRETALKDTYNWDYATLEKMWRVYCATL